MVLDILAAPQSANLEDRMLHFAKAEAAPEDALSFRILASIVEEFSHQQYHSTDFVTLRVACRAL